MNNNLSIKKNVYLRVTCITLLILLLQSPCVFSENSLSIGTTYSSRQSEYLEMDPRETYLSVLDMGFSLIRVGAYWSDIEKEKDVYDFTELDWQIDEAARKNIPIVLTVGMKAPRWPEYFIPDWIKDNISLSGNSDASKQEYLRERTLKFIEKTVKRYNDRKIIHYWQVENEALNRFGGEYWYIGRDFLEKEVDLVRKIDAGKRKIILTAATYPNGLLRFLADLSVRHDPIKENLKLCDILGLNVYPIVGHDLWGLKLYFRSKGTSRRKYFSKLIERVKEAGKDAWIVEFQAEPWEPGHLVYKDKKRPVTSKPLMLEKDIKEFYELGFKVIFLWGAEYWCFRDARHDDRVWVDAVEDIIKVSKE